jgi:hypothetical protein
MSTAQTVYEVRQAFGEFECSCKKTFKTLTEAKADRRVLAAGSRGIFYHREGNYADVRGLSFGRGGSASSRQGSALRKPVPLDLQAVSQKGDDSEMTCSTAILQIPRSQRPDNNLQDNHRRHAKQWNEKSDA